MTDLLPLAGTSEAALTEEITKSPRRLDLSARVRAYGRRPIDIIGAERGVGAENRDFLAAARQINPAATGEV